MNKRYLQDQIQADLKRKMCFVGGPRQVGKTTLDMLLLGNEGEERYYNWDAVEDRDKILRGEWPRTQGLLILDEIHKYRNWRGLVKGLFDKRKDELRILVTGSARLDYYRRGGDSLQGRYFFHRLHPLSFKELGLKSLSDIESLMTLSGFPEPFFGGSLLEKQRWSKDYRTRVVRDDVASLEVVSDISALELLAMRIPELVGSPISLNSLREDLQVAHATIRRWCDILERLFFIYRLSPFGAPKLRAVKKEQKAYCWDWSLPESQGARFENLIAGHLLKWVHYIEDTQGREIELRYFRDTDQREVDFVVVEKRHPILFVECKLDQRERPRGLEYLKAKFPDVRAVQVGLREDAQWKDKNSIEVMPATRFLDELV